MNPIDEQFAQWLTGFLEGDGTIGCYMCRQYKNPKWISQQIKVDFAQKEPTILEYIHSTLGCGNFTHGQGTTRLAYQGKARCIPLLGAFTKYIVSEHTRQQLSTALKSLGISAEPSTYPPTLDWIAGFWDAEGGSTLSASQSSELYIKIYQKDRKPLDAVRQFLDAGYILGYPNRNGEPMYSWIVSGHHAHDFGRLILPLTHSGEKRQKLTEYLNTYTTRLKVAVWMRSNPKHPIMTKVVDRMRTEHKQ